MNDKNDKAIEPGCYVKRCGKVLYADGLRFKVSKKTWLVSRVEDGRLFYESRFLDHRGEEVVEEVELKRPKIDGNFIVVGDADGLAPEFAPPLKVIKVSEGSVAQNYRVLKEVKEQGWKQGDIVQIIGKVAFDTLHEGFLELVGKDVPHKHVLIVVDPIRLNNRLNHG